MPISIYSDKLASLNVDRSSGHPKPHKICLLLAIIDLIESGKLTSNSIVLNDDLKTAFTQYFNNYKKGNDVNNIMLPFFHLVSDGFWHFKIKPGKEFELDKIKQKSSSPSAKSLFNLIDYAYLDEQLFNFLQSKYNRLEARQYLLENLDDLSIQFHRWLLSMGKSERTANSYVGAIKGTLSNWANDSLTTNKNLISIQSFTTIDHIAEQLATYNVFQCSGQVNLATLFWAFLYCHSAA